MPIRKVLQPAREEAGKEEERGQAEKLRKESYTANTTEHFNNRC